MQVHPISIKPIKRAIVDSRRGIKTLYTMVPIKHEKVLCNNIILIICED